jgi:hypothetical protein
MMARSPADRRYQYKVLCQYDGLFQSNFQPKYLEATIQ